MKFCQGKFRLDLRKKIFTQRVVENWNGFTREVVSAPILTGFKKHLGNALRRIL